MELSLLTAPVPTESRKGSSMQLKSPPTIKAYLLSRPSLISFVISVLRDSSLVTEVTVARVPPVYPYTQMAWVRKSESVVWRVTEEILPSHREKVSAAPKDSFQRISVPEFF